MAQQGNVARVMDAFIDIIRDINAGMDPVLLSGRVKEDAGEE